MPPDPPWPSQAQRMLARAWCPLGRGVLAPSSPEGCAFTPTLHPYPPSTQSRNLGSCQKNTHFILFFIFLIKGLHIIVCLTKTKVLVSEFENYFPKINGIGSLINIF